MSTSPADQGARPQEDADDLRRMAPVYIGVIVVEAVVLVGLWVFQTYFGAR